MSEYTPQVRAEMAVTELRRAWEECRDWWGLLRQDPSLLAEIEAVHSNLKRRLALIRFEDKFIPEPNSGCWLWLAALQSSGHGSFAKETKPSRRVGTMEPAHRVSWMLYRGPIPDGMWVLHKCDNKLCVNPDHLYLGTVAENARDWRNSTRWKPPYAKLTESQVREIYHDPRPQRAIAEQYGVTHDIVGSIKRRQIWRHVKIEGAA